MQALLSLILLISLASCSAPPEIPVVADCVLVAVEGIKPYLMCKMSDGSGESWRVDLPTANPQEKYICTTAEGYVAGKSYAHELNDWVKANCKGVK